MLTFGTPDPGVLDVVGEVVQCLRQDTEIAPSQVMVVGAHARNIIHSGLGESAFIRLMDDVDLALALPGWDAYEPITKIYPRLGGGTARCATAWAASPWTSCPSAPASRNRRGQSPLRRERRRGPSRVSRTSTITPKPWKLPRKGTLIRCHHQLATPR